MPCPDHPIAASPQPLNDAAWPAGELFSPGLWQAMVQARQRGGGQVPAETPKTAADAAALALYQPLLDARRRMAAAALPPARPWVIAQLGQSLDGCVATASGDSYYVTGPQSLVHLHALRALCDAVMIGAGSVVADDPLLTTRHVPGPQPVRVVLDPAARLDGRARVLREPDAPTLWLCDRPQADAARARLQALGGAAEVLGVEGLIDPADPSRGPDLPRALAALAARGLRLLLVEGGGVTVSRCMAASVVDRLHLVIAPVIIGAGRRGLQHPGPLRMADCPRPPARRHALGDDVLWDLDFDHPSVPAP